MSNDPPKKRALATTLRALHNPQSQNDSSADGVAAQATLDPFERFRAVWAACVTPAGRKLVLLALTDFANADGTGIRPAVATIAARCNISPKQARRHIHDLVELGVLRPTREASQHRPAVYSLNFQTLSALPHMGGLGCASTPTHDPQHSHGCPSALPPMGVNPGNDPGKTTPRGGLVSSGSAFGGPKGVNSTTWNKWVKKTRPDADELVDLVKRGEELHADGANLDALVQQALDNNWRHWPRVCEAAPVRGSKLGAPGANWGMPS